MRLGSRHAGALALSLVLATVGAVTARDPSGVAVKVDPRVNASDRVLEVEGAVFMGDRIVSGTSGLAQVRFLDDTRLVIGPNSVIKIDKFVFNPDQTAKQVTLSALKGAFRFISGRSRHRAYSIRTPTFELGVRGTVIDFSVRAADSSVVIHEGSGEICDRARACVPITDDCTMFVVPPGGGFSNPTGVEKRQRLAVFFPFVVSQGRLDPAFRTSTAACGSVGNIAPQGGTGGSGTGSPGGSSGGGSSGGGGSDSSGSRQ